MRAVGSNIFLWPVSLAFWSEMNRPLKVGPCFILASYVQRKDAQASEFVTLLACKAEDGLICLCRCGRVWMLWRLAGWCWVRPTPLTPSLAPSAETSASRLAGGCFLPFSILGCLFLLGQIVPYIFLLWLMLWGSCPATRHQMNWLQLERADAYWSMLNITALRMRDLCFWFWCLEIKA